MGIISGLRIFPAYRPIPNKRILYYVNFGKILAKSNAVFRSYCPNWRFLAIFGGIGGVSGHFWDLMNSETSEYAFSGAFYGI